MLHTLSKRSSSIHDFLHRTILGIKTPSFIGPWQVSVAYGWGLRIAALDSIIAFLLVIFLMFWLNEFATVLPKTLHRLRKEPKMMDGIFKHVDFVAH